MMENGELTAWHSILPDAFVEVVSMDESHGAVKIESGVGHRLVVGLSRKRVSLPESVACLVE